MRFLVDEDLPRSAVELLRRHGHEANDVRDLGLRGAKDSEVASYARQNGLCLLTGDFDFSDIRNYPPAHYSGIVVLKVPYMATCAFVLQLLDKYLERSDVLTGTFKGLVIVEPGRIRVRK